jgi:hypothetical protein
MSGGGSALTWINRVAGGHVARRKARERNLVLSEATETAASRFQCFTFAPSLLGMSALCQKRTCAVQLSALCQKRTSENLHSLPIASARHYGPTQSNGMCLLEFVVH